MPDLPQRVPAVRLALCAAGAVAAWTTTACGVTPGEPVGPPASAFATASCGPTDGAAVEIVAAAGLVPVRRPVPPYVRVVIARPLGDLAGRTWGRGEDAVLSAVRQPAAGESEEATRGTITVRRVAADTTIEGALDFTFPSGARVRQSFRAAWQAPGAGPLCG